MYAYRVLDSMMPMDEKYRLWAGNHLCFCHRMGCMVCYMILEIQMADWGIATDRTRRDQPPT